MKARWGFLEPWCAVLKRKIQYRDAHDLEMWESGHVLDVTLPTTPPDFDHDDSVSRNELQDKKRKAREALALLAAVEHVDKDAWKFTLKEFCQVDVGSEGEEKFETIPVRFWLALDLEMGNHVQGDNEFDLVQFCGINQWENSSAEYVETLIKIAAMDAKLQYSDGVEIEIPISVNFPGRDERPIIPPRVLMDIARAEREIQRQWEEYDRSEKKQPVKAGSLRCKFVLEPMVVDFLLYSNGTGPEMAETMERLVLDNVRFSLVKSLSLRRDEGLNDDCANRKSLGQLLRRVFDSTRRSPDLANINYYCEQDQTEDSSPLQLGVVDVYGSYDITPEGYMEAMCSAMMFNQTTKKVVLNFEEPPDELDIWYRWMMYGIFSKQARTYSSLETIVLHVGSMSKDDVLSLSNILLSEHPEEDLCETPRGELDERDAVLKGNAPIRWDFNDDGTPVLHSPTFKFPARISSVRTFSDDGNSEWVDVIVPGVGKCQVRRSDLTFYQQTGSQENKPKLLSLTLRFATWGHVETDGLHDFIAAIGPSLRSLTIAHQRIDFDASMILHHCPNLEELSLCGGLVDVLFDTREYRATEAPRAEFPSVNWHDMPAIVKVLNDAKHPITKCVRRLRIQLTNDTDRWNHIRGARDPRGFEIDLQPLLQMLAANKSLEYVEVIVRLSSDYGNYMEAFRKYHLQAISRALKPLPIESKVAFLSIFSSQKETNEPYPKKGSGASPPRRVFADLTQELLSNIFSFAAPPVLREVYFVVKELGYGWYDGQNEQLRNMAADFAELEGF